MPTEDGPDRGPTPSQTIGPFFHYGLPWKGGADLVEASELGARPDLYPPEHYRLGPTETRPRIVGEVVEVRGRVLDGAGTGVPDAMVECWGADARGRFGNDPDDFIGFGRTATGDDGSYRFRTLRPGAIGPGHAPHLALSLFGRGLLNRLATRLYFDGDPSLGTDPVLVELPAQRRETLIASRAGDGAYVLDLHLQGARETVFFDL